ncbi:MAG: Gfo/Idh/MocA family oxidoreductase [Pirellulales bacterium]
MLPANHVSRRHFLASGTAAAAVAWTAKSYARVIGANDRIRIGFIGAGGMGNAHLDAINQLREPDNVEAVAVADCWLTRAEEGANKAAAPHAFGDYRKLLDLKQIDYVNIATPEHWHARMTLEALDAGKAVYCEKPMTHSIPEALEVVKKQQATGLALQVGVQAMSDDSYASAAEAIEKGVIGRVVQAQIEYVRRYDQAGPWRAGIDDNLPRPADLDWDAWLGKAPKIEWNPHHYHEWRNYSAYSGGICTDLFIHRITRIMRACKLTYPRRVVGMGGIWQWPDGRDLPDNFEMICEYPRGMTVYVLGTMSNRVGIDHLIRGYRGTLYFTPSGWVAKDKDGKTLASHERTGGEDINLHHNNLHRHLREGVPLNCPAELGLAGVVAVNMANESWRSGQMMGWDKQKQAMVPANTIDWKPFPEEDTAA